MPADLQVGDSRVGDLRVRETAVGQLLLGDSLLGSLLVGDSLDSTTSAPLLGSNLVLPSGIASREAFGTPSLTNSRLQLRPTGIASGESFGRPTVLGQQVPTRAFQQDAFQTDQASGGSSGWKPDPPATSVYTSHPTGTITLSSAVQSGATIDTLFHPTTQKVVATADRSVIFAVGLTQDNTNNHNPSTWQMKKSTDGGSTWSLVWNSASQGDPQFGISPALELDENENLYVIANYYPSSGSGSPSLRLYKFSKASGYDPAQVVKTTITTAHASGKWGVCLDQGRQWIWIVLWADTTAPNLYAIDYTGAIQYSRQIFKVFTSKWHQDSLGNPVDGVTDKHGEPAYPTVSVGVDGTVYVAWNNMACEGGDFTNAALSYYDVRMVYCQATKAQFAANNGSDVWMGPLSGVSGTASARTVPFAGDDSGTQAETAYQIVKNSNTTDEFIPASDPNYGFAALPTTKKYNFSRLMNAVPNNGALHFYYESETSDTRAIRHHSYARFRMSSLDIDDAERRSPDWHWDISSDGDRASTNPVGQGGGVFVTDTTQAERLYFVTRTSRDLDEKILVLRSDDGGLSWYQYALSAAVPGGGSNGLLLVQAYRWTLTDGSLVGILQLADSPNTVFTFTVTPS